MLRSAPLTAVVAVILLAAPQSSAFQPISAPRSAHVNTALAAQEQQGNTLLDDAVSLGIRGFSTAVFTCTLFVMTTLSGPAPAVAVSGGGLDYANIDITGQDFSNEGKLYKGKDFSVCTHVCRCYHLEVPSVSDITIYMIVDRVSFMSAVLTCKFA